MPNRWALRAFRVSTGTVSQATASFWPGTLDVDRSGTVAVYSASPDDGRDLWAIGLP